MLEPLPTCPLREDGHCTITGLSPLLCPGHVQPSGPTATTGGQRSHTATPGEPVPPCVPCQHHDSFFGGVL